MLDTGSTIAKCVTISSWWNFMPTIIWVLETPLVLFVILSLVDHSSMKKRKCVKAEVPDHPNQQKCVLKNERDNCKVFACVYISFITRPYLLFAIQERWLHDVGLYLLGLAPFGLNRVV